MYQKNVTNINEKVRSVDTTVRTEKIRRVVNDSIVEFFTPKIKVNNRMVFISDENTASGIIECESRKEAIAIAKSKRDELIQKKDDENE